MTVRSYSKEGSFALAYVSSTLVAKESYKSMVEWTHVVYEVWKSMEKKVGNNVIVSLKGSRCNRFVNLDQKLHFFIFLFFHLNRLNKKEFFILF